MCGRFTLKTPGKVLAKAFSLADVPELPLRFNVAPTQAVAAIRMTSSGRRLDLIRWGLVPAWIKDFRQAPTLVNARSETLMEKPSFRAAFQARRCLVPADGFYEWKTVNGKKQPMYFTMKDSAPFALAGLWERWEGPDGTRIDSFALLTTEPNAVVADVHDRMPVIVPAEAHALWLDPGITDARRLQPLLAPFPAEAMQVHAVSPRVNSVACDDASCIESIVPEAPPEELRLF